MVTISNLSIFILVCILYLLGWVITHFLCEYKHFWCKGKCKHCRNWQCKFFKMDFPDECFSCSKGDDT